MSKWSKTMSILYQIFYKKGVITWKCLKKHEKPSKTANPVKQDKILKENGKIHKKLLIIILV